MSNKYFNSLAHCVISVHLASGPSFYRLGDCSTEMLNLLKPEAHTWSWILDPLQYLACGRYSCGKGAGIHTGLCRCGGTPCRWHTSVSEGWVGRVKRACWVSGWRWGEGGDREGYCFAWPSGLILLKCTNAWLSSSWVRGQADLR